jgi:hypothetical protein
VRLVHILVLRGAGRDGKRLFLAKELKIGNERRRIVFLHYAATRAARILSADFSGGLDEDFTTAIWICAMPEFPRFHDHGLRFSFCAPCAIFNLGKMSGRYLCLNYRGVRSVLKYNIVQFNASEIFAGADRRGNSGAQPIRRPTRPDFAGFSPDTRPAQQKSR